MVEGQEVYQKEHLRLGTDQVQATLMPTHKRHTVTRYMLGLQLTIVADLESTSISAIASSRASVQGTELEEKGVRY